MDGSILALTRTNIEGSLVIVTSLILFGGSTYMLVSAVTGRTMGYLITATGFFAFMIILSALWVFGAPGTTRYLGPKGDLAAWVPLEAGTAFESGDVPAVSRYPADPWQSPTEDNSFQAEVEPATLAMQEFLAEEATKQLGEQGLDGEITPEDFEIENLRFTEVDDTPLAIGEGFAAGGGPQIRVVAYKDPGDEPLPSYVALIGSVLGFIAHLPFLDRAERRRKEVLTGGDQAAWRGPA